VSLARLSATGRILRGAPRPSISRDELRALGHLGLAAMMMGVKQRSPLPKAGSGFWSSAPYKSRVFESFVTHFQIEQQPCADNRVMLGATRDALGVPRVRVLNRFTTGDVDSFLRSQQIVRRVLRDPVTAEMLEERLEAQLESYRGAGMAHHTGTTRMHDDPRRGVVDRECRVHGLSNLYCAGSSVFPTSGYANPTLTIIALAIRLADHLKGQLGLSSGSSTGGSDWRPATCGRT
jgi:choline dehydrogenase-like flavoprotein